MKVTHITIVCAVLLICVFCNKKVDGDTQSVILKNISKVDGPKSDIASGTFGTCNWTISDVGTLSIGSGTLKDSDLVSPWIDYTDEITSINFINPVTAGESSEALFKDLRNVTKINNLNLLDTSNTTNMFAMFEGMTSLQSIDLSNFKTSKVTTMSNMFYNLNSLSNLNLKSFDTSNVVDMSTMFAGDNQLASLDLNNFDTSDVYTMRNMFSGTNGISNLDLRNFNTSKVTDMSAMFSLMSSLTNINVSNFDTSEVSDMSNMFIKDINLKELNLTNFKTSKVESFLGMFNGVSSIENLNLGSFDTSSATTMANMFANNTALRDLDLSTFDTLNVTDMSDIFSSDTSLTKLNLENFDTSSITKMNDAFIAVPLRYLKLGNKTFLDSNVALSDPLEDNLFSGKWQTVGEGSAESPTGDWVGNSAELISRSKTKVADIYVWQPVAKSGILQFVNVPPTMSFNETKISNRAVEVSRQDPAWKIKVEDSRATKNDWQVTAQLKSPFKNDAGQTADLLNYRQSGQSDQAITTADAVDVFNGQSTADTDYYDVSWGAEAGPLLKVAPGTVKAGKYTGTIEWSLIDAPV